MTTIFDKHPRPWWVARFSSGAYLLDANSNILDESEDVYAPLVSAVNAEPELRSRIAELEHQLERIVARCVALESLLETEQ